MDFIFKRKFSALELASTDGIRPRLAVVSHAEEYLAALYAKHLQDHDFVVQLCADILRLEKEISRLRAHVLVIDACLGGTPERVRETVRRLHSHMPELHVITVAYNLPAEDLKQLMSAGVSGHVDRKFSRPEDVAVIAKTLLNH